MTTEWEDILISKGIMAPKIVQRAPTAKEYDEMAAENREVMDVLNEVRQEQKSLEELEDELDDDDVLEAYRKKRMAEMQKQAEKDRFGYLKEISEPDYKAEVTQASDDVYVVVFLHKAGIPACQLLHQHLSALAQKCKSTKFVKIRSEEAIPNYPDKNLPTLLIYRKGDIVGQCIGLSQFGGEGMRTTDLEWALKKLGCIESDMEKAPAPRQTNFTILGRAKNKEEDSDDDE